MALTVVPTEVGHRLAGDSDDVVLANRFLEHLTTRSFAPATVRAYAFDVLSSLRFSTEHDLCLAEFVDGRLCGHGFRKLEKYRRVLLHAGGVTWPNRPSAPRIRTRFPHSNA